jgi:hypothetical protein
MYNTILEDIHPDRLAVGYSLALNCIDVVEEEKALKLLKHIVEATRRILEGGQSFRVKAEKVLKDLEEDMVYHCVSQNCARSIPICQAGVGCPQHTCQAMDLYSPHNVMVT